MVFIIFAAAFFFSTPCKSVEYYVLPTSPINTTCPSEDSECHQLDYYAQNTSLLSGKEHVSLLFLEGLHTSLYRLHINQTKRVLLTAYSMHNETRLTRLVEVEACLEKISLLEINQLSLESLGTAWDIHAARATLSQLSLDFLTTTFSSSVIEIKEGHYVNSRIILCNGGSKLSILLKNVIFLDTVVSALDQTCQTFSLMFVNCNVTGELFHIDLLGNQVISIEINNSRIVGPGQSNFTISGCCNELAVKMFRSYIAQAMYYKLVKYKAGNKNMLHIHYESVEAGLGNLLNETFLYVFYIGSLTSSYKVILVFKNTTFSRLARVLYLPITFYSVVSVVRSVIPEKSKFTIKVIDSHFKKNFQCIVIGVPTYFDLDLDVCIVNSDFKWNQQALQVKRDIYSRPNTHPSISFTLVSMSVTRTDFTQNLALDNTGIIEVVEATSFIVKESQFIANIGTAIKATSSGIIFEGQIVFKNNTANKGGGISLHQSTIHTKKRLTIVFINNHADDVGGAIYVEGTQSTIYKCFLKPLRFGSSAELTFMNNSAIVAGNDIYGASLYCPCSSDKVRALITMFIFYMYNSSSLSSVSSDPKRVCLCDDQGTPKCVTMRYIYRQLPPRYPGEMFTVPAVVVGYDFGIVPGVVYTSLLLQSNTNSSTAGLLNDQHVQEIANHQKCGKMNLTIQSKDIPKIHSFQLVVGQKSQAVGKDLLQQMINNYRYPAVSVIESSLLLHPIILRVPVEECPTGFLLTDSPPYICTCHHKLEEKEITVCVITNHTGWVYRSGTLWISSTFTENETNSFIIHQYCPYDYCKPDNVSLDLTSPDTQCAFNRSGLLCGGCYGNLSLALGTSRCIACDNSHVSLLIVFIMSGLVLVFFIKILDLTISKGTTNGIIFYANIVWANKSILFPTTDTMHPTLHILHTFIAWLNLDLGIETCFINGLNSYWKTWLQFVFPIYIWSIIGIIIITSRYSTTASKIFGNNSVPVLATLILLSYTKLLRTIITSLAFSVLEYPDSLRIVWSFDGNIPYFGAAHLILFLVAIAALLLLWLPYTTVLLTLQWLRRKGNLKLLQWINRWKPFFDAYFGQLKPKHHYWVGLLLLVRVLLLVLLASTSAVIPRINILAVAFTGVILFIHLAVCGLVYKTLWLSILELSFLMNLTVLAILKLYIQSNNRADAAIVYTSIAIAFTKFIAIITYHVYVRIKSTYFTYKRRHTGRPTGTELRVLPPVAHNQMHYREPLLESSGQS